jgi:hypothetical protein
MCNYLDSRGYLSLDRKKRYASINAEPAQREETKMRIKEKEKKK